MFARVNLAFRTFEAVCRGGQDCRARVLLAGHGGPAHFSARRQRSGCCSSLFIARITIRLGLKSETVRADAADIATGSSMKRLAIRRPGTCSRCGHALEVGTEALWDRDARTLTCIDCSAAAAVVTEGRAGASAQREYARRHAAREQHARDRLGGFGVLLARLIDEPQSTRAWQQGARGEVRTGERLGKLVAWHDVRLLHDRRVPGHGRANIDHLAIGPAGVLVIDTKTYGSPVRTDWVGGLFAPRRTVLLINGRDQTRLIDSVERQVGYVRDALRDVPLASEVEVRGALCFPNPDGLPLFKQLRVRGITIEGPRSITKLARRPGAMSPDQVEALWQHLGRAFPPA